MNEPDEGLGDVLNHITMLLGVVTREYGAPGALSYSRMRLLGTLEEVQPATQHELAQAMLVSDAAVSRMLTALVPEGLVTVEPDPSAPGCGWWWWRTSRTSGPWSARGR